MFLKTKQGQRLMVVAMIFFFCLSNKQPEQYHAWGSIVSPLLLDMGLNLGYSLNENSIVHFDIHRGTIPTTIAYDSISLNLRDFVLGNSSYLDAGLGYVKSSESDPHPARVFPKHRKIATLNFGAGNHWFWENGFNMGVYWIGWQQPVAKFDDHSMKPKGVLHLARFELGHSF